VNEDALEGAEVLLREPEIVAWLEGRNDRDEEDPTCTPGS
jgi:hypothetical protein